MAHVTTDFVSLELEVYQKAVNDQFNHQSDVYRCFMGKYQPKWYECGAVYDSGIDRTGHRTKAICHKFAGHPGRHAKRRASGHS